MLDSKSITSRWEKEVCECGNGHKKVCQLGQVVECEN
jgi:hypothetical protein